MRSCASPERYSPAENNALGTVLARRAAVQLGVLPTPLNRQRARRHSVRFLRHTPGRGNCATTHQMFRHFATSWFSFLGRLAPEEQSSGLFDAQVEAFEHFMREERELSEVTILSRCQRVGSILEELVFAHSFRAADHCRRHRSLSHSAKRPRLESSIIGSARRQSAQLLPLRGRTALVQSRSRRSNRLSPDRCGRRVAAWARLGGGSEIDRQYDLEDYDRLLGSLRGSGFPCRIAFELTSD